MSEPAGADVVLHTRRSVNALLLLPADRVPQAKISPEGDSSWGWKALRDAADEAQSCAPGEPGLLCAIQRSLDHLPLPRHAHELERLRSCVDDGDPHDAYFRVARTDCPAGEGYLRGLLHALGIHLSEAQSKEEAAAYRVVPHALKRLWCDALGVTADAPATGDRAEPLTFSRPAMQHLAPDPVRRWVRGHQVFAVITQGLIWSFHQLGQAVEDKDGDATVRALNRLTLLFDASAAGFRFASNFDPRHYADTIRPSMCEPHVAKGFSGTLSSDHGRLVSLMVLMRPVLAQVQAQCPQPYAAMTDALSALYEDHKFVCERFDGGTKASLRGEGRAGAHSGVEMLDRFKTQRMKIVG